MTKIFDKVLGSRSQAFQESFVLNVLDFKREGYFLEIGAAEGFDANNTLVLETTYSWGGLALEWDGELASEYNAKRKVECLCIDATQWSAKDNLDSRLFPKQIDYLQVDIDPSEQSLSALLNLPFSDYRFSVITFEHDYYLSLNSNVRDSSREFLFSNGYHLFAGGIETQGRNFEDWWIDLSIIQNKHLLEFQFFDVEASDFFR